MLEINSLSAGYGRIPVLEDISVEVRKGEILALVGPNGAGKSTLLRTVMGTIVPASGTIDFKGVRLNGMPSHRIAGLGIAHVQEGRRVFGAMSVRENLIMGAFLKEKRHLIPRNLDFVCGLFPRLSERMNQQAGTLSGGEQQMLAIGRALMMSPELILLDEPSLGLAPLLITNIYDTLSRLNEEGMTILLVEQNVRKALAAAGRAYVIENGKIVLHGGSQSIMEDPRVISAYLGI